MGFGFVLYFFSFLIIPNILVAFSDSYWVPSWHAHDAIDYNSNISVQSGNSSEPITRSLILVIFFFFPSCALFFVVAFIPDTEGGSDPFAAVCYRTNRRPEFEQSQMHLGLEDFNGATALCLDRGAVYCLESL